MAHLLQQPTTGNQQPFTASTLLHQYQRQQVTQGVAEPCVIAALDDVELANRLMRQTLGTQQDGLLPQTRSLLEQLDRYVEACARERQIVRDEVRFTQREVREALGWSDRTLRRNLNRLVELEYALTYRAGRGNQRVYHLLYHGQRSHSRDWQLGLCDVQQLPKTAPHQEPDTTASEV